MRRILPYRVVIFLDTLFSFLYIQSIQKQVLITQPMREVPTIKNVVVDLGVTFTRPEGIFKKMEGTIIRKVCLLRPDQLLPGG
jgi:succinate dehydrogenase/fumarate reductase-like Fe-S protein